MKFSALIILSTLLCKLNAWNIATESLQQKCLNPAPQWMNDRINRDLKPFQNGVLIAKIEETLNILKGAQGSEHAHIVHIKLKEGKASWSSPLLKASDPLHEKADFVVQALELIHESAALPDCDFLLSLDDRCDRPVLLRNALVPIFTASKLLYNTKAVLIPDSIWKPEGETLLRLIQEQGEQTSWDSRREIAFWRGSASGGEYPYWEWDFMPRPSIVIFSQKNPDLLDARFINNEHMQAVNYHVRTWFFKHEMVSSFVQPYEQLAYKYLVAVDGDGTPSSMQWQLLSQSALLKFDSKQIQWYSSDLRPYVHYIPFKQNLTDLEEKILGLRADDAQAKEIAQNAKEFAKERLMDEETFQYVYKLLHAYARLQR